VPTPSDGRNDILVRMPGSLPSWNQCGWPTARPRKERAARISTHESSPGNGETGRALCSLQPWTHDFWRRRTIRLCLEPRVEANEVGRTLLSPPAEHHRKVSPSHA